MRTTQKRAFSTGTLFLLPALGLGTHALAQNSGQNSGQNAAHATRKPAEPVKPASSSPSATAPSSTTFFTSGNVVVLVEGCGVQGGTCTSVPNGTGTGSGNSSNGGYGDNQAAPVTLFQFAPNAAASASYVNSLVIPQNASGANLPISGEYGSSSEGTLQLSGQGQYLSFGAYGINAAVFDAAPATYGASPSLAEAQSGSLTGQSYTPVARVVSLVDPYGNTNSSSALFNIYNTNNPRSVYTADGMNVYLSGQGASGDATGGVFYSPLFTTNNAPTAITGKDTTSNTASQDTRTVQIYNGTLYISVDSKAGSNAARSYLGTLGNPPATTLYQSNAGPTQVPFANNASTPVAVTSSGKLVLTASETNGINATGQTINLSASNYFFANASTLYIADTGNSKQNSASTLLGDGGLQKWVNTQTNGSGTWLLQYTISAGLNLVANTNTTGTTGLYGLTGVVSGTNVYLYATNATLSDLDTTYLYGFSDVLNSTAKPSTSFALLATAPSDSNFKGVSMAPTLAAGSATILTSPTGLTVSTSGTGCVPGTYVTPVTLVWTPGSACTLTTTTPQGSYVFSNWQDGTTGASDAVTAPAASATYTATFADATTTAVTPVNPASVTVGSSSTLTASVVDQANSAGAPAGTVTFTATVNGMAYPAGSAPVSGGIATLNYTTSYAGSNIITATFTPTSSAAFGASADATGQTLTVAQGALATGSGGYTTVTTGGTTTLNAVISYPGSVTPTGAITLTVNGSTSGVGSPTCLIKAKHMNCAYPYTTSLAPGTYTVNFSEAGDANYTATPNPGVETLYVQGQTAN